MVVASTVDQPRRHDLDLVRVLVVAGLIVFHTACVFVPNGFYVTNRPPSYVLMMFVFFTKLWGMPLLFMVAGVGIWHSLSARSARVFVRERLQRLLVPLLVGILVVVPPQLYYFLLASGRDPGSYWDVLHHFLDVRLTVGFPSFLTTAHADGLFELSHLWFLYYLLLYSLLLLPVFLYLRRDAGRGVLDWLAASARAPWASFVLVAVPVVLIEVFLGTIGPGSWHSLVHLPFLLYGFVLEADRRLSTAVQATWKPALAVGVLALAGLFVIAQFDLGGADSLLGSDHRPWSLVFRLLQALAGWAWTFAIYGLATSLGRSAPGRSRSGGAVAPAAGVRHRLARYANEAVLPFYVLHQTPIVVIAFYVVRWNLGIPAKFLAISASSLAVTLLIYDLCVRRANLTRVLFGMCPKRTEGAPARRLLIGDRR